VEPKSDAKPIHDAGANETMSAPAVLLAVLAVSELQAAAALAGGTDATVFRICEAIW
jgi:hypothetical protein